MLSRLLAAILAAVSSSIAAFWLFLTITGLVPGWSAAAVGVGARILQAAIGFTGDTLLTIAAVKAALYARRADRRWLRWGGSAWFGGVALLILWLFVVVLEYPDGFK